MLLAVTSSVKSLTTFILNEFQKVSFWLFFF